MNLLCSWPVFHTVLACFGKVFCTPARCLQDKAPVPGLHMLVVLLLCLPQLISYASLLLLQRLYHRLHYHISYRSLHLLVNMFSADSSCLVAVHHDLARFTTAIKIQLTHFWCWCSCKLCRVIAAGLGTSGAIACLAGFIMSRSEAVICMGCMSPLCICAYWCLLACSAMSSRSDAYRWAEQYQ